MKQRSGLKTDPHCLAATAEVLIVCVRSNWRTAWTSSGRNGSSTQATALSTAPRWAAPRPHTPASAEKQQGGRRPTACALSADRHSDQRRHWAIPSVRHNTAGFPAPHPLQSGLRQVPRLLLFVPSHLTVEAVRLPFYTLHQKNHCRVLPYLFFFVNVEPILIRLNSPKSSSELLLSLWRQKLSDHSSSTSDSDVLFFRLFQHRNAELIHNSTSSFFKGFFF